MAGMEFYQALREWKLRALSSFVRDQCLNVNSVLNIVSVFMAYTETPLHFKIIYRKADFICKII